MRYQEWKPFQTNDYQHCGTRTPAPFQPVEILVMRHVAFISFVNTSEAYALNWVNNFMIENGLAYETMRVDQDSEEKDAAIHITINF